MNIQKKLEILNWLSLEELQNKSMCKRKHIGAILVDTKGKISGAGYNHYLGTNCLSFKIHKCPRYTRKYNDTVCPAIHAEVHAILNSLSIDTEKLEGFGTNKNLVDYFLSIPEFENICKDFFMFCTYTPCPDCMRILEYVGVSDIFSLNRHNKTIASKDLNIWLYRKVSDFDYVLNPF